MSTQNYTNYAFGADCVDDCPCPATAAGRRPGLGDVAHQVASRYDTNIRTWACPDEDRGIVNEETAKEHWMEAVRDCEQLGYDKAAEVGRSIADELGWL